MFAKQRIDYAIAEVSPPRFFMGAVSAEQLIIQSAVNSEKELKEEIKRSFRRRIVNAVQQLPLGKRLFAPTDEPCTNVSLGRKSVEEYAKGSSPPKIVAITGRAMASLRGAKVLSTR